MPRAKAPKNGNPRAKQAAVSPVATEPNNGFNRSELENEIRRRAYELYERRGCEPGHEHEDWLLAEQEVVARYQHQGV